MEKRQTSPSLQPEDKIMRSDSEIKRCGSAGSVLFASPSRGWRADSRHGCRDETRRQYRKSVQRNNIAICPSLSKTLKTPTRTTSRDLRVTK